jgi:hypothetical protein
MRARIQTDRCTLVFLQIPTITGDIAVGMHFNFDSLSLLYYFSVSVAASLVDWSCQPDQTWCSGELWPMSGAGLSLTSI